MAAAGLPRRKRCGESMARCLVGCGSNLGERRETLDRAIELLKFMPGVEILETSRFHESKAVGGPAGSPSFLNGACLLETELPPRELLGMLQAVENTLERQRDIRWGPRTIDLDLLLYESVELWSDDLVLPHPRLTTRRFVLEPCAEIAPEFLHPTNGRSIRDLLENISRQDLRVSVCGVPGSGASEVAATVADASLGRFVRSRPSLGAALAAACGEAFEETCREAAAAWHLPPATAEATDDPQATVSDVWIGSLAAVAGDGRCDGNPRLHGLLRDCLATAVPPHVLLVLRISPDCLAERLRFCRGPLSRGSDVFPDLQEFLAHSCEDVSRRLQRGTSRAQEEATAFQVESEPEGAAHDGDSAHATLLSFQERLLALVTAPRKAPPWLEIPMAVIQIDAGDLGDAASEAVAAVEAMA